MVNGIHAVKRGIKNRILDCRKTSINLFLESILFCIVKTIMKENECYVINGIQIFTTRFEY